MAIIILKIVNMGNYQLEKLFLLRKKESCYGALLCVVRTGQKGTYKESVLQIHQKLI